MKRLDIRAEKVALVIFTDNSERRTELLAQKLTQQPLIVINDSKFNELNHNYDNN